MFSHDRVVYSDRCLCDNRAKRNGGPISAPPSWISYGKVLCGWKGFSAALDLCQLSFEVADLFEVTIDPVLDLLHLTLFTARSSLSAHISVSEGVNVTIVLALDQVVQILVIEALAIAGHCACHFVVVQIDAHLAAVSVD